MAFMYGFYAVEDSDPFRQCLGKERVVQQAMATKWRQTPVVRVLCLLVQVIATRLGFQSNLAT